MSWIAKSPSQWIGSLCVVSYLLFGCVDSAIEESGIHATKIDIPETLLVEGPEGDLFGGDIRIGDLTGDGKVEFLVYRSEDDAHDGGGMKPCFMGAFNEEGKVVWKQGKGGRQPSRPGPVAIHDIDGDGESEVITFWLNETINCPPTSLRNVVLQIRNGKTGEVERESAPEALLACEGQGANWVHQRLLICNLRGTDSPRDFVVKLGKTVLAFNQDLQVLWSYTNPWDEYTKCPAYIPSVGDIDGDGRDEVNGGYFLLDDDGSVMWEKQWGRNMDSVAIAPWDNGRMRAFGSGFGHVLDEKGNVILELGEERVPHGQELRVADYDANLPGPEMMIRYEGHTTPVMLVGNDGQVVRRFELNESPNNTGMETVYWHGPDKPALLYNGGQLWRGDGKRFAVLPGLPEPIGNKRQGWYHCIPADLYGGPEEEIVVYNPWDRFVAIFRSEKERKLKRYEATARQYNARLMD